MTSSLGDFTAEDIHLLARMVKLLAGPYANIAGVTPDEGKRMDTLLSKVFNHAPLEVRAVVIGIDPQHDVLVKAVKLESDPTAIENTPRDPAGGPRPGDAFLVEGRRAPLIVDQVWHDEAPQPDGPRFMIVSTADGQMWALFRRPETADGPPFPPFTGSIVTSHPDPDGA